MSQFYTALFYAGGDGCGTCWWLVIWLFSELKQETTVL
jgi:hypothetical protein